VAENFAEESVVFHFNSVYSSLWRTIVTDLIIVIKKIKVLLVPCFDYKMTLNFDLGLGMVTSFT
jgi:hypothetical protein